MRWWRRSGVLLGLFLLLSGGALSAAGVKVQQVQTQLVDGIYYLEARLAYVLTERMLEALHQSVPLIFELNIEVFHVRNYWFNDVVASLAQRYQLAYLPLTQQYQVSNLNSGLVYNLPSLQVALSVLGTVIDLPLLDQNLLVNKQAYRAQLRVQLDINALPVPLRLLSYFSDEWSLRSKWTEWPLQR